MSLKPHHYLAVERFCRHADIRRGALFLDLDGTALVEEHGDIFISRPVERGIRELADLAVPVVLNTLRFPLSVIRGIGREWLGVYGDDIPAVLLNGGVLGYIKRGDHDDIYFKESVAFPIEPEVIDDMVQEEVEDSLAAGKRDLALFFYPRDWQRGEIIWIPEEVSIEAVKKKYPSASEVVAWDTRDLRSKLIEAEPCMASVVTHYSKDKRMAYQHSKPGEFYSADGVDKAFGTRAMAKILGISVGDSAGAGDTEMDSFLKETGLAIKVGPGNMPFMGTFETINVGTSTDLGEMLSWIAHVTKTHNP